MFKCMTELMQKTGKKTEESIKKTEESIKKTEESNKKNFEKLKEELSENLSLIHIYYDMCKLVDYYIQSIAGLERTRNGCPNFTETGRCRRWTQ